MAEAPSVLTDAKQLFDKLILQKEKYRKKREKLNKAFEESQRQGNASETINSLAKHVKAQDHEIDNIHDTLQTLVYIQKKILKTIYRNKLDSKTDERSVNHFKSDEASTDDEKSDEQDEAAAQGAIAVDEEKAKGDKGNVRGKGKQSANSLTTPENSRHDAIRLKEGQELPNGTGSTISVPVEEKVEVISADMAKKANGMKLSPAKEIDDQTGRTTNVVSNKGQRQSQNQAFVPIELWQSQAADISVQANKLLESVRDDTSFVPGLYTVICLDSSASMAGERWRVAQEFLQKYFRHMQLEEDEFDRVERVALVVFGDEIKLVSHFTRDYKMIQEHIGSIVPSGSTNLFAALTLSQGVLEGGGLTVTFSGSLFIRPRILLISDGYVTCPNIIGGEDELRGPLKMGVDTTLIGAQILSEVGIKIFPLVVTGADDVVLAGMEVKDAGLFRFLFRPLPSPDTTPEDETDIQQIIKEQRDRDEDVLDSNNYLLGVPENMPPLGARVRRGPEWNEFSDLDGKGCGTVIGHRQNGYVRVQWDNNNQGIHQYGADGRYGVVVVDEPRLMEERLLSTGCKVMPGQDWDPEDEINETIKLYDIGTVVWPNGKVKEYAFGYRFHHEVKPYKSDGKRPAVISYVQERLNSIKPRQPSAQTNDEETAYIETQQNMIAEPSSPATEDSKKVIDAMSPGVNGEQIRYFTRPVQKNKNARVIVTPQRSRANSITSLSGQVESSSDLKSCEFYWEYRVRDKKTWKAFPSDVSNEIEDAFQEKLDRTLQVDQGGQP